MPSFTNFCEFDGIVLKAKIYSGEPIPDNQELPTKPCSSKTKRKETRYECVEYENKPPLCVGECFNKAYHVK